MYEQLAAVLRDQINKGQLPPGQLLPSERTLQQQYGLARETVRRSIAVLRAEGLLEVRRGQGVVVKEHHELRDLYLEAGVAVTARMPIAEERAELDIGDGVPVFVLTAPDGSVTVFASDRWRLRPAP